MRFFFAFQTNGIGRINPTHVRVPLVGGVKRKKKKNQLQNKRRAHECLMCSTAERSTCSHIQFRNPALGQLRLQRNDGVVTTHRQGCLTRDLIVIMSRTQNFHRSTFDDLTGTIRVQVPCALPVGAFSSPRQQQPILRLIITHVFQGHTFLSLIPHRDDILVVLAARVCSDSNMAAVNLAQDPSERPGKRESFDCFAPPTMLAPMARTTVSSSSAAHDMVSRSCGTRGTRT